MLPKQPPFTLPTNLVFFILLLYSFVFTCQHVCNHQDLSALLAFRASILTSPSVPLNWSSPTCCQWEGIECDLNGRVSHLQLSSRGLEGLMVISSISSLVMLTHLNLSNNHLQGPLGEEISGLINLIIIDLSSTRILGSIPQEIGKLLYLEKLHLHNNNLSGHIPSSLMNCTNLVEILLRDNHLNGDISKLDFSRLVQLQIFDAKNNSLNGTLPESIYLCKSLVAIGLADNNLTGQISSKISDLKSLSFVALVVNSFTNITGTLRALSKCKNLTTLFLSHNFYGESLPVHKNFIGLDDFPKLQFFSLRYCEFTRGPIPNWLSSLKNLRVLSLVGNRMIGKVPNWFGTLPKLFRLDLDNNSLSGKFPLKLCLLPALISQNGQTDLKISQFELPIFVPNTGTTDTYFWYKASFKHRLGLSHNEFSGNIPEDVGNLKSLQELELNNNHFSGHVPISISCLRNLEVLDLSTNNLTGEIPASLANLTFLSHFNVSYNDLEGPIPTGGQLDTFEESSFEGNPGLFGEQLKNPHHDQTTSYRSGTDDNGKQFLHGLFVGLASGFSSTLIGIASYVWFNNCMKYRPYSRSSRPG